MTKRRFYLIILFLLIGTFAWIISWNINPSLNLKDTHFTLSDSESTSVDLFYRHKEGRGLDSYTGLTPIIKESNDYNDIKSVFWDDKYIIAKLYEYDVDTPSFYYIVEILQKDTIYPWELQKYDTYNEFCEAIHELGIDTLDMHHLHWKTYFYPPFIWF